MTDTERLDFLDLLTGEYTNRVILRGSTTGRGWRLHESSRQNSHETVREAIDAYKLAQAKKKQ